MQEAFNLEVQTGTTQRLSHVWEFRSVLDRETRPGHHVELRARPKSHNECRSARQTVDVSGTVAD